MELNDDMQRQAKALADPSRFRLFSHIVESDEPTLVAEVAEAFGFNHNNIRQHLAVLVEAGLVLESTEHRTTRGRPRKQYVARRDALDAFRSVSGSYQRLSELLLDMVTTGEDAYAVGVAAGETDVATSAAEGAAAITKELVDQLATEGFEPCQTSDETAELNHCPFADLAEKNPGVVCELHRGLINGQLAAHPGYHADLIPQDPRQAGCRVVLRDLDRSVPTGLRVARRTPTWTSDTVPPALLENHKTSAWATLIVEHGSVAFTEAETGYAAIATPGRPVVIVPDREHRIEPSFDAEFAVEFYADRPGGRAHRKEEHEQSGS